MDLRQIKDLMQAMGKTGMHRLEVKNGDFELKLEHGANAVRERVVEVPVVNPMRGELREHRMAASPAAGELPAATKESEQKVEGTFITSPMVGTFYVSPGPDDPPFIKVGDRVEEQSVVCIVEAMKVMNEVKAGVSGVIAEILVENAHPVEFGSKLFRIKPE